MIEFVATVVMPVRNEELHILSALDSVLAQDVADGALEVLVVDGQSTDRTRELVSDRASGARFPVRVLENVERIAATAMNVGVAAATADVIVRVDGHCELPKDYVSRLVEVLARTGAVAAGGTILPVSRSGERTAISCAMQGLLGHGGAAFRSAETGVEREVDTVAFPAYQRSAIEAVGGFDPQMVRNQDDDLHLRLREAGGRILIVPDLLVRYRCRETLDGVMRQYFGYGFWKVVGWRKRGRLSTWRALGPALLVAWIVGSAIGLAVTALFVTLDPTRYSGPAIVAWLFIYLLLQMIWFVPFSFVARWTSPRQPGAFRISHGVEHVVMAMHLAYGVGFWRALLSGGRPPGRWG